MVTQDIEHHKVTTMEGMTHNSLSLPQLSPMALTDGNRVSKFFHVVRHLQPELTELVHDILTNLARHKYNEFKITILQRATNSFEDQLQIFLADEGLSGVERHPISHATCTYRSPGLTLSCQPTCWGIFSSKRCHQPYTPLLATLHSTT